MLTASNLTGRALSPCAQCMHPRSCLVTLCLQPSSAHAAIPVWAGRDELGENRYRDLTLWVSAMRVSGRPESLSLSSATTVHWLSP